MYEDYLKLESFQRGSSIQSIQDNNNKRHKVGESGEQNESIQWDSEHNKGNFLKPKISVRPMIFR